MYKPNFVFCYKDDLIYIEGNVIIKNKKFYGCYITLKPKLETQREVYNFFPSNIYKKLKNV